MCIQCDGIALFMAVHNPVFRLSSIAIPRWRAGPLASFSPSGKASWRFHFVLHTGARKAIINQYNLKWPLCHIHNHLDEAHIESFPAKAADKTGSLFRSRAQSNSGRDLRNLILDNASWNGSMGLWVMGYWKFEFDFLQESQADGGIASSFVLY